MDWRGFELHPETPPGGRSLREIIPPERLEGMRQHMLAFAASHGVEGFGTPERSPNTRRALALVEYARDQGRLEPLWHAAMDAHWSGGLDLERDDHLRQVAAAAGLDPDAAVAATHDQRYLARVDDLRTEATSEAVQAIPTFLFGDGERVVRVVGCQPYERVAAAAEQAGARARQP